LSHQDQWQQDQPPDRGPSAPLDLRFEPVAGIIAGVWLKRQDGRVVKVRLL
jgi:hypothetical protein